MDTFDYATEVRPTAQWVTSLLELLQYEYIGMYGEPDPNPEGGLDIAWGPHGSIVIAHLDGFAVGICGIVMHEQTAVLRRMFVRWEHRGKGISKRMLSLAEELARNLGADRLVLETGTEQTVALELYKKAGYEPVEPFGFYAQYAGETSVFLGKAL